MILHEVKIPYDSYNDVFTIKPIFDVHLGNKYCDERAFKKYLENSDDRTYFIGGGDLLDSIITKDVKRYVKHADASETDSIIDEQIEKMYNFLLPYKDRIIGLGTGNHEAAINKYHGTHPIRRLCKKLDTVSLGFSWLVKLIFKKNSNHGGDARKLIIRGHHGWGGGSRTQGADLTKYSKDVAYWAADIFLYGHVHRRQWDKIDRLAWGYRKKLVAKPKHIFICGTFLKTLSKTDEATYAEEKGYPPVSIGGVNVKINVTRYGVHIEPSGA